MTAHNKNKHLSDGHFISSAHLYLKKCLVVSAAMSLTLVLAYPMTLHHLHLEAQNNLVSAHPVMAQAADTLQEDIGSQPEVINHDFEGYASWYSREGCIGCSETLTMANGQPLDDNAMTVAFNKAKLGTKLRIVNTRNNAVAYVTVTDTGGFERHGRILDVTPAVRDALNLKTDKDLLKIWIEQ